MRKRGRSLASESDMKFNPNLPAKTKQFFWATFIPDRAPKFKMYSQRGHALNSFQYREDGILYEWDAEREEWTEVYRLTAKQKSTHCENCGEVTQDSHRLLGGSYLNRGHHVWIDKETDFPRLIWACYDCERLLRKLR